MAPVTGSHAIDTDTLSRPLNRGGTATCLVVAGTTVSGTEAAEYGDHASSPGPLARTRNVYVQPATRFFLRA